MTRVTITLLAVIAAALVSLHWPAHRIAAALERQAGIADTLAQAQLISTWEAVDIIKDVYEQIAFYSRNDSIKGAMVGRMEGFLGREGKLRKWRAVEKRITEKEVRE